MPARVCKKVQMPDGTIFEGPLHGADQTCLEWANPYKTGGKIKNPRFKGRLIKTARDYSAGGMFNKSGKLKYSPGGMLVGPSHEEGGIQAIVDGTEPIEVEGGEFVINKPTVDAVGEDFLHKLNHTSTPHHDPATGYQSGVLPPPSNYKDGGKITENRGNTMAKRSIPRPTRRLMKGGYALNRDCGGPNQHACGGRVNKQNFQSGGRIPSSSNNLRSLTGGGQGLSLGIRGQCKMHDGNRTNCIGTGGCTWNPSTDRCV